MIVKDIDPRYRIVKEPKKQPDWEIKFQGAKGRKACL